MRTRLMWPTFIDWQEDWSGHGLKEMLRGGSYRPSVEMIERRHEFLRTASPGDRALFSQMVERLQEARQRLIATFAPIFEDVLDLESRVACTLSMTELLELTRDVGRDSLHSRRRFEALSLFDQAAFLAAIEEDDAAKNVMRDLNELIEELSQQLFRTGGEQIALWTKHDPKDHFRVEGNAKISKRPKGRYVKRTRFFCRHLKDGGRVMLHHRVKKAFDAWRKIQVQVAEGRKNQPFNVRDRCGLKMVVPDIEAARSLLEKLLRIFVRLNASVSEVSDNLETNGRIDHKNTRSSTRFRAIKFEAEWQHRTFEIQIVTFRDYISAENATDEENHHLYKLRECVQVLFPLLWPSAIYQIHWKREEIHRLLSEGKIHELERRIMHRRR